MSLHTGIDATLFPPSSGKLATDEKGPERPKTDFSDLYGKRVDGEDG